MNKPTEAQAKNILTLIDGLNSTGAPTTFHFNQSTWKACLMATAATRNICGLILDADGYPILLDHPTWESEEIAIKLFGSYFSGMVLKYGGTHTEFAEVMDIAEKFIAIHDLRKVLDVVVTAQELAMLVLPSLDEINAANHSPSISEILKISQRYVTVANFLDELEELTKKHGITLSIVEHNTTMITADFKIN